MNHKNIFLIFLFVGLFVACQSPARLIQHGNNDQAFRLLAKKMYKNNPREKHIGQLQQSLEAANETDLSQIRYLKMSGEPSAWPEIFDLYRNFDDRQLMARNLPQRVKDIIHFQPVDIAADLVFAKNRAQEYLFAKANQLLSTKDRNDAAQALEMLNRLRRISPDYPGLNTMVKDAEIQATKRVYVEFVNQSGAPLPDEIVRQMMQIPTARLDEKFLAFDLKAQKDLSYDGRVDVLLTGIAVSPERVDRRQFTEKKEIQDGKQPKRDARGNILYDSTGKVIEEPRYRMVEAMVNEVTLNKEAVLSVKLDFLQLPSKRSFDHSATDIVQSFAYRFATVNGDLRACSPETLKLTKLEPLPFPTDTQMIFDAAGNLNKWLVDELMRKKSLMRGGH